jgi:hypothetical protein
MQDLGPPGVGYDVLNPPQTLSRPAELESPLPCLINTPARRTRASQIAN